ncbi:hypothetical protein CAPTEDRAFT_192439 [Capitella teleta]|uniref:Globin domain-containing protein n=1 Tax=Capitella teleta TaxID=283909 RepID=R7VCH7_CAPTE|nr:hypothetical protein CAPTEDRAFT_192439 [Capitella teleta]|eukprot:ELU16329.1 hypothetical protein CAPTEDRAFT_192439 [Capitella teleta]
MHHHYKKAWNNWLPRRDMTDKDLKNLFVNLVPNEDVNQDGAYQNPDRSSNGAGHSSVHLDELLLKKHAHVVMEALGAAVECLEDSVFLSNVLVALGQIHATYHVKPMYLPRLWPAIRHGLKEVLQDVFTEQVEDCWRIIFNFIISKMKEGIRIEKHHHTQAHHHQQQQQQQQHQRAQQNSTATLHTEGASDGAATKASQNRRESLFSVRENMSLVGSKRRASRVAPLVDTGQNNKDGAVLEGATSGV